MAERPKGLEMNLLEVIGAAALLCVVLIAAGWVAGVVQVSIEVKR